MAITSVLEAREASEKIAELSRKVGQVPGLGEGHIERLHASLQNLIRDFGRRPWWHHRYLVRELDALALEVKGLGSRRGLAAEFVELFDLALYRLRQRRFRTALKLLRKAEGPVSLNRERTGLLEEYRRFRQQLEAESKAAEEEAARLRRVPVPEAGPADVEAAERLLADAGAASAAALREFLARSPGREVLRRGLEAAPAGPPFPAPPDPETARDLLRLLGLQAVDGELARADLYTLLEAARYTEARFAHLAPDSRRIQNLLKTNIPWLQRLSRLAEPGAVEFPLQESPESLRQRASSLLLGLAGVPGAERALHHLQEMSGLIESGRLAALQRSARVYRAHGEEARKKWDGTLEPEISQKERALEDLRRDLRALPAPETL